MLKHLVFFVVINCNAWAHLLWVVLTLLKQKCCFNEQKIFSCNKNNHIVSVTGPHAFVKDNSVCFSELYGLSLVRSVFEGSAFCCGNPMHNCVKTCAWVLPAFGEIEGESMWPQRWGCTSTSIGAAVLLSVISPWKLSVGGAFDEGWGSSLHVFFFAQNVQRTAKQDVLWCPQLVSGCWAFHWWLGCCAHSWLFFSRYVQNQFMGKFFPSPN